MCSMQCGCLTPNSSNPASISAGRKITAIDAEAKRVTTDRGTLEADHLVIALGADYDYAATPGMADATEFYSVAGAAKLAGILPEFRAGRVVIGVAGTPFKCPPAPSEAALMMHDYLEQRGIRAACDITLILPLPVPVPPSPEMSRALLGAFAGRGIRFVPDREIASVDMAAKCVVADDGMQYEFDLFLGVPAHRAAKVLVDSGMTEDGYVPVNPKTLETRFPGVYAVGDCARQGTPKAGVFAEGAARAVAETLTAKLRGEEAKLSHRGTGTCYIEFGGGKIGSVDIDFSRTRTARKVFTTSPRSPSRRKKNTSVRADVRDGSGCLDRRLSRLDVCSGTQRRS